MNGFSKAWRRLTEPSVPPRNPAQHRQIRLLLVTTVVIGCLLLLVGLSLIATLAISLTADQRREAYVVLPILLGCAVPWLYLCHELARRGQYRWGARLIVAISSALSFFLVFSNVNENIHSLPVVAVVLASILLPPIEVAGTVVVSAAAYLLLPLFAKRFGAWDIYNTLIVVVSVGLLSGVSGAIRALNERQLERQAEELAKNQERILGIRKMQSLARLSAGIAHELNNALTVVKSYSELIRRRPGQSSELYADQILIATDRAAILVDRMLSFSQQQVLRPKLVNLDDALASMRGGLGKRSRLKTRLQIRRSPEPKLVRADPELLRQAIEAFVEFADRADTLSEIVFLTTITETLTENNRFNLPPGPYAVLTILGRVLASDVSEASQIFDPFFTYGEFGTGNLELAAAFGTIRQSGGQVVLSGSEEQYDTIVIALPLEAAKR